MDYDKTNMPGHYDTARGYDREILQFWLDTITTHVPKTAVDDIVDLGCGTGRYSEPLAQHYDARVIGIDPSEKMLAKACQKHTDDRVSFRQGGGEALPVEDASADMVFMSMAFHHLKDPEQTARECRRVLRKNGYVFVRNGTTEQIPSYPHVDFYPGVQAVMEGLLPSRQSIVAAFENAGLKAIANDVIAHRMAPSWADFADKMAHRADSTTASLSDADFEAGMAALRGHAAGAPQGEPVMVNVEIFVFSRPDD